MSRKSVCGYAGKLLRVDLSREKLSEVIIDEGTLKDYVGGAALGVKILYDEVSPTIRWSDPSNRMILASGPLGGTNFPGSGTISIVTKGALTGGAASGQANGLFGAYLKFSGYDGLIVQGVAKNWVYLNIKQDEAELKEANQLLGKGTYETYDLIKRELDKRGREVSVISIGPAGEGLSLFAGLFERKGHSASKNGPGAVLGSKKLKAIAVSRGNKRIEVKHPDRFKALADRVRENASKLRGTVGGVHDLHKSGQAVLPVKNYTTNIWNISDEELEKFSEPAMRRRYNPKPNPCWACPAAHSTMMTIPEGPYAGMEIEEPEYEQLAAWGPQIDNRDVDSASMLSSVCDQLGFDNNEMGWMVGWLMECYERGLLSGEQLNGLEMTWGNVEAARELMYMIAHRQGVGDILAEGIMRASQRIGGEAAKAAIYTLKGNTPRGHDHRTRWGEMFDTIVSNTGTLENHVSISGLPPYSEWAGHPEEVSDGEALTKGVMILNDSLGNCRFPTGLDLPLFTDALNAITGWDLSQEDANNVGLRAVNLMKVFNLRAGIGREMDAPSERYGSTPVDGPNEGVSIRPVLGSMLRNYYGLMGWDEETSKPLPETLRKLGLGHVIGDIW
jgi:aldehyde:ferredoxin oxidoreductase